MQKTFQVPPIRIGINSPVAIKYGQSILDSAPLASGRVKATFKHKVDGPALFSVDTSVDALAVTRTALVDDISGAVYQLTLNLTALQTALITQGTVVFDVLVYDGAEAIRLPGEWHWPAKKPITTP